ncbi:MAG: hypothetical protein U1E73_01085 [Planctomycetota bacterium]
MTQRSPSVTKMLRYASTCLGLIPPFHRVVLGLGNQFPGGTTLAVAWRR